MLIADALFDVFVLKSVSMVPNHVDMPSHMMCLVKWNKQKQKSSIKFHVKIVNLCVCRLDKCLYINRKKKKMKKSLVIGHYGLRR